MGIRLLSAFFVFGACASGFAAVTLTWPGTALDRAWALNPEGHAGLLALGPLAAAGMAAFSVFMACTARGLLHRARWAWWAALLGLAGNTLGDLLNAALRHDLRTLVGVPLAALVIAWLLRPATRAAFR
jgi:hypothetical protein